MTRASSHAEESKSFLFCAVFLFFFSYSETGISGQTAGIRTSIYYTGPTIQRDVKASGIAPRTCGTSTKSRPPLTPLQPSNDESTSAISQSGSCIKKKVAWADQGKQSLFFLLDCSSGPSSFNACLAGPLNNLLSRVNGYNNV